MGVSVETIAVLLMAYGSPENLDDLEPYLLDIRGGRPTSPELVAEIRERYAAIGGRSPLLDLTRTQAAGLQAELNRRKPFPEVEFQTFVGMRHWQPRIRQAVEEISDQGIRTLVGLVMAPHQSTLSSGAYFQRLQEAVDACDPQTNVLRVESWHDTPGLIAALAQRGAAALAQFEAPPFVLFTAHSLPARILQQGDPYDTQLRQTAALVAERLQLPEDRWQFCFQSAGQSPEPWLGPSIDETVLDLIQKGEKNILAIPVGFVCDHVEILYDLDVHTRHLAQTWGARFERSESLNASPLFISALADVIIQVLTNAR
jgi:ferrochelatase